MHKTKVLLTYSDQIFSLTTESGFVLWSGRYVDLNKALEFARAYMSNMAQTELIIPDDLAFIFYEQKERNDKRYLNRR